MAVISKTSNVDIQGQQLSDVLPESLRRAYIYKVVEKDVTIPIMTPNGISVVRVQNIATDSAATFSGIKTDMQGHNYIDIVYSSDLAQKLGNAPDTQTSDITLRTEKAITLYTNSKFYGTETDRYIFTLNSPYNLNAWSNGSQLIYTLDNAADLDILDVDDRTDVMDEHAINDGRIREIKLDNVREVLKEAGAFTKMYPVESDIAFWENTDNLELIVNKEFQLANIFAKAIVPTNDGSNILPINFVGMSPLTPSKIEPTSIENKVEYFHDWADTDTVLGYSEAEQFIGTDGIDILSIQGLEDIDRQLISDAMLFTFASTNQYSGITRNDQGKYNPGDTIGHSKTQISALLDSNDIQLAINKLVESHLMKYPNKRNSTEYRIIRSVMIALSRFIRWSDTVGKGNNPVNEVYLPWYLDVSNTLLTKAQKDETDPNLPEAQTLVWENEPIVKLKSKWFDIVDEDETTGLQRKKGIYIKDAPELSKQKLIQSERKIILDDLPTQYTSSSLKSSINPGDVNTKSVKDLNYIVYTPSEYLDIPEVLGLQEKQITYKKGVAQNFSVPYLPVGVLPTAFWEEPSYSSDLIYEEAYGLDNRQHVTFKDNVSNWPTGTMIHSPQLTMSVISAELLSSGFYDNLSKFKHSIYDKRAVFLNPTGNVSYEDYEYTSKDFSIDNIGKLPWVRYTDSLGYSEDVFNRQPASMNNITKVGINSDATIDWKNSNRLEYRNFPFRGTTNLRYSNYYKRPRFEFYGTAIANTSKIDYAQSKLLDVDTYVNKTSIDKLKDYFKLQIASQFNLDLVLDNTVGNLPTNVNRIQIDFPDDLTDINNWEKVQSSNIVIPRGKGNKDTLNDVPSVQAEFLDSSILNSNGGYLSTALITRPKDGKIMQLEASDYVVQLDTTRELDYLGGTMWRDVKIPANSLATNIIPVPNQPNPTMNTLMQKYWVELVSEGGNQATVRYFQWRPKNVQVTFLDNDVVVSQIEEGTVQYDKNLWSKAVQSGEENQALSDSHTIIVKESSNDINTNLLQKMVKFDLIGSKGSFIKFKSRNQELSNFTFEVNSNKDETINKTTFLFV